MKTVITLLGILLLSGCASDGSALWMQGSTQASSCPKLTSDQEFALNLAQNMADEGRLHASLANLEGLPDTLGEVRLRKARVLRLLGSNEAEPLYRSLLGTCRAAQGEHGLGQLAAARGDNVQAQQHLLRASKLEPTDEKIRNDLGVVYLNQLKLEQARFQFLTAMELKQSDTLAALNLVTLLIYQDNWTQAAELASRASLTPEQITAATARAEKLKPHTAGTSVAKPQVAAMLGKETIENRAAEPSGARP
ncbi:hypothetical protein KDX38_12130 [Pseudomonas sp. CDFA 602]|uniref:hypothetical protein n=1 Tax=Pseudomonas californiensis TaxID=2829823 RepID=UPI001E617024|nr:hypothetical protein [Pseudomonas californiensis]MCD5994328.1 hypothetical protein [Pseudomonas californiensis]MCD5999964.1 hypothetical protein [Pseudomonas californiensis]